MLSFFCFFKYDLDSLNTDFELFCLLNMSEVVRDPEFEFRIQIRLSLFVFVFNFRRK